jgi:thiamine-phosphate diphosphorylase / hydroxyethylthiazole kinase
MKKECAYLRCYRIAAVTIAAELAVESDEVKGPGTFMPALIDKLATLQADEVRRRIKIKITA